MSDSSSGIKYKNQGMFGKSFLQSDYHNLWYSYER